MRIDLRLMWRERNLVLRHLFITLKWKMTKASFMMRLTGLTNTYHQLMFDKNPTPNSKVMSNRILKH